MYFIGKKKECSKRVRVVGKEKKQNKTKPALTHAQKLQLCTRCCIYIRSRLLHIKHNSCPYPMPLCSPGDWAQLRGRQEQRLSPREVDLHSAFAGVGPGPAATATGDLRVMGTGMHGTLKAARRWRQLQEGWLAFGEASTCPIFYYLFILINSTLRPDWGSFVLKGQLLPWGRAERYQLSKWGVGGVIPSEGAALLTDPILTVNTCLQLPLCTLSWKEP